MLTTLHSLFELKKGKIEEYELHWNLTISNSFNLVGGVICLFLDSLSKFRKTTNSSAISACLSVCLFVSMEQLSSGWTDFQENWNVSIFKNPENIQVLLTFRHRASCISGQAFHYSPENAFYIFNQQIYFIILFLFDRASLI